MVKDLPSLFENVRHIPYCLLDNFDGLPNNYPVLDQPLKVLTSGAEALISLWGLTKVGGRRWSCGIGSISEQTRRLEVELFIKGKSTFPDRFEALLLQRAVIYNHCVKIPSSDLLPYMRLYWLLFYDNILAGTPDRKVLIDFVSQHTGDPMTPKDKSLKIYKR